LSKKKLSAFFLLEGSEWYVTVLIIWNSWSLGCWRMDLQVVS